MQTSSSTTHRSHSWLSSPGILGTVCGCISAVGYTAANCCLRAATDIDPIWVSCIKAFPTFVIAGAIVAAGFWRGRRVLPSRQVLIALALAGLFAQLGGNVLFQYALGVVGIGLTVPLCLGMIIFVSAILARMYLNESVTPLTMLSMGVLIVAIWVLSLGAGDAYQSIAESAPSGWLLAAGVGAACFSGFAYAVLGVVIRYGVTGKASVAVTTFTVSIVGVMSLGMASYGRMGWEGMIGTTPREWGVMVAAGMFNFIAFVALTRALQLTTLIYVNALNASQVAMAAAAGVLLFGESPSSALTLGVVLTAAGLLLMPRERRTAVERPHRPKDPTIDRVVQNERNRSSSSASSPSSHSENSLQGSVDEFASMSPVVERAVVDES